MVSSEPILLLGGSGFIGSRLTVRLIEKGFSVKIGDLRPTPAFADLWAVCDVRDQASLRARCRGVNSIINLAAEHRDDVRPASRYRETNIDGARFVCMAAREAGIPKIVFTSSVAVYGFQPRPVDEEGPLAPFNAYGETKLEAEGIYREWADEDSSRTLVIVRPTVVFGEGNRGNVYNLLYQLANGRFCMVGSGTNIKSMAYVENVAAFLTHTLTLPSGTHIFNYVDTPEMDTKTLVEHVRRCLGKDGKLPHFPEALALAGGHICDGIGRLTGRTFPVSAIRVQKFCANTQFLAERVAKLGFQPPYSLVEGLSRTIHHEFLSAGEHQ